MELRAGAITYVGEEFGVGGGLGMGVVGLANKSIVLRIEESGELE